MTLVVTELYSSEIIKHNEICYLHDRKQFVRLETANSPSCSVTQGSKLSSVLYNIYINEMPLLYKLINDNIYTTLTFEKINKFTKIYHTTVNFVDDPTSIIIFLNNELSDGLKYMPVDKFRNALRQYVRDNEVLDSHD